MTALLWGSGAVAQEGAAPPTAEAPPQDAVTEVAEPVAEVVALPKPTISEAIAAGKLIFEARARYENVEQTGITPHADASTLRIRLGWETAEWMGVKALIEYDDVRQIGTERYNVAIPGPGGASLNGKTTFPVVNDPEATELNRLQLTWTPNGVLSTTLGRQRLLIDDQRFVGNVGWRQDEQTFDAARFDLAYGKFKATYAFVDKVNRIFGEARDWDSNSHIFNATWAVSEPLKVQVFDYALDFSNSLANSTETVGGKVGGKVWLGLFQLAYNATYAQQSDYARNPADFKLDYYGADIAGTFDIYTAKLSYESFEGNGTLGFSTPLATVHAFQGWSDAFATAGGNKTHVDGLKDLNVTLIAKPRFKFKYLFNTEITARYHDFDAERTSADLAAEWDVQISAAITTKLSALIKYADFDREETVPAGVTLAPADRRKAWFSLEYKL